MDAPHWSTCIDQLREVVSVSRLGIISDFDGTLAHFWSDPFATKMVPENADALDELAGLVTLVALVSGRPTHTLQKLFTRPYAVYHGSHGLDYWDGTQPQLIAGAVPYEAPFQALLAEFGTPPEPGVVIENKRVTGSVHYRQAPDAATARTVLYERLKPITDKYGFILSEGRWIWEIKPPVDLNKGTSVRSLIQEYRLDGAIFLGDDITDLSAIQMIRTLHAAKQIRGIAVGVLQKDGDGPREVRESCDMIANDPDDVARLLNQIVALIKERVR